MDRIADKLSEIEMTARAIVENAEEQKHLLEKEMQEKRNQFDIQMEQKTEEKLQSIQKELEENMEQLLDRQEQQNRKEIEFLKKDFKEHHTDYAKEVLHRIIEI